MAARNGADAAVGDFEHPALLYASLDEFLESLVPFVEGGLEQDEPVFVAVGAEELGALRDRIGAAGEGVQWADTREWQPYPAPRLRAFHEYVTDELAAGATRVRLVGEPVWPAGPPDFVQEWKRYESVLNHVLGPYPVSLVCTYSTARLDPSIVADAHRTHPVVRYGRERPSEAFEEPAELLRRWTASLEPPPPSAARMEPTTNLSTARRFVEEHAIGAGVGRQRATELSLAATEVITNAFVHAGGPVALASWTEDDRLLCQIDDGGDGIGDILAGYTPPGHVEESGRGLWLARQLVDLLQIAPGPSGTTVRLQVARRRAT